jgi:hypothetical protein
MMSGLETIKKKNGDYTDSIDPFKNFYVAEALGVADAPQALLVRMADKISRIATLTKDGAKQNVKDESINDTLMDLMNYAAILKELLADRPNR